LTVYSNRFDVLAGRNVEHHVEHHFFENRTQGAGTGAAADGFFGKCAQGIAGDPELHIIHCELLAVLLDQRVFWLGEDGHQLILGQFPKRGNDGQAADEFRNQSKVKEIFRLDFFQNIHRRIVEVLFGSVGMESEGVATKSATNHVFQADERAADNEQNFLGVDLDVFLLRVLASSLGRDIANGAFEDLK